MQKDGNLGEIDTNLLLKISNLTKGKLYDRRKDITKSIILAVLSNFNINSEINVSSLKDEIFQKTKLKMDETIIITELSKIEKEKIIIFKSENKIQLIKKINVPAFSSIILPVWKEFEKYLKEIYKEYDIYLDESAKKIFERVLIRLITQFDTEIEKLESQLDSLDIKEFKSIISKDVENSSMTKELASKYPEIICSFFELKTPNFLEFIFNNYTSIINIDLLKIIQEMPTFNFIKHIKFLLLDTNFIISLLCKKHEDHPMAVIVTKQCLKSNIPIYYAGRTQDEMLGQISTAKLEMRGLLPGVKHSVVTSPFVEDFLKADSTLWNDYASLLDLWETTLKSEFNINILPEKFNLPLDQEVYAYIEELLPILDQTRNKERHKWNPEYIPKPRSVGQLTHDAVCISLLSANRDNKKETSMAEPLGPWFLSFDGLILSLDRALTKKRNKMELIIHPKNLMNYLLAFSKIEYKKDDELEVAGAIISFTCRKSESNISIKEYSTLITNKMGMDRVDSKIVESVLFASPLRESLELALEKDHGEKADEITSNIIANTEFVDKVLQSRSDKEKIILLSKKLIEERASRETAERIAGSITINLSVKLDLNIKTKLDGLLTILESENAFKDGIIEKPQNLSTVDKLLEWLRKTKEIITTSNEIGEGLKVLIPVITQIITALS